MSFTPLPLTSEPEILYKPRVLTLFLLLSPLSGAAKVPCATLVVARELAERGVLDLLGWDAGEFHRAVVNALEASTGGEAVENMLFDDFEQGGSLGGYSAYFQKSFARAFDALAFQYYPTPLAPVEKQILILTHQEKFLYPATARKIDAWVKARKGPHLILAHPEHALVSDEILQRAPAVRYSPDGSAQGVAALSATLGGGHLDACLATTVRSLVSESFRQGVKELKIKIDPGLVYLSGHALHSLADLAAKQPAAAEAQVEKFFAELRTQLRAAKLDLTITASGRGTFPQRARIGLPATPQSAQLSFE